MLRSANSPALPTRLPADLLQIFGATDEDVEKLRIVSLYDVDIDAMESLIKGSAADAAPGEQGSQPDKPSS